MSDRNFNFRSYTNEDKTDHHILRRQSDWVNLGEMVGFIHDVKNPKPDEDKGFSYIIRQAPNEAHNIPVFNPYKIKLPKRFRFNSSLTKIRCRIIQNPDIQDYPSILLKCVDTPRDPMTCEVPKPKTYLDKGDPLKGFKFHSIEEDKLKNLSDKEVNSTKDEFRNVFEVSGIVVSCYIKRDESRIDFTIINGRGDIIPCVAFGRDAHNLYGSMSSKTVLLVSGRVINQRLKINAKEAVIQTVLQVNKAMPPKFGYDCPKTEKFPAWMIEYFEKLERIGAPEVDQHQISQLRDTVDNEDNVAINLTVRDDEE